MTYSINRLEAFSDGVIAIIITLLVFNLPVPALSEGDLGLALLNRWAEFVAFLVSFFIIGVMWVNHHDLFRLIQKGDKILFLLNNFLLLGISIVPFTTRLMATYLQSPDNELAGVIYASSGLITALGFNVLWRYASHKGRLISETASEASVKEITRNYNIGFSLYFVAFLISFFSAPLTLAISFCLALFFALPSRENTTTRTHTL